jgi:hypothetical protein
VGTDSSNVLNRRREDVKTAGEAIASMRAAYQENRAVTLPPHSIGLVLETLTRCYAADIRLQTAAVRSDSVVFERLLSALSEA